MIFQPNAKLYLEIAVGLLESRYFEPIVFCHDDFGYNENQYREITIALFNVHMFLDACGVCVSLRVDKSLNALEFSNNIIIDGPDDIDYACSYTVDEIDYSNMDINEAKIPSGICEQDFLLIKLYLLLKSGSAINKKTIEKLFGKKLSDSNIRTIRKQIEDISEYKIIKRKDNSYELR